MDATFDDDAGWSRKKSTNTNYVCTRNPRRIHMLMNVLFPVSSEESSTSNFC